MCQLATIRHPGCGCLAGSVTTRCKKAKVETRGQEEWAYQCLVTKKVQADAPLVCDACQHVKLVNHLNVQRAKRWRSLFDKADEGKDAKLQKHIQDAEIQDRVEYNKALKKLSTLSDNAESEKKARKDILDHIWDKVSETENHILASEALMALFRT